MRVHKERWGYKLVQKSASPMMLRKPSRPLLNNILDQDRYSNISTFEHKGPILGFYILGNVNCEHTVVVCALPTLIFEEEK